LRKKTDYIVALKGNQGTLRDDAAVFVDDQKAVKYSDTTKHPAFLLIGETPP
jgi:hypothetical protein